MGWYKNRSGEQLWYEDQGEGCTVVLLHGWCMSSAVWRYQFNSLTGISSDSVRLVAPDLRGHGRSCGVTGSTTFEECGKDLVDLFDALNLTKVVLVAWSMGAQIALQAYNELSNSIAGMVLVSATPCFAASDDFPHGLATHEVSGMRVKVKRNMQRARDGFMTRLFAENELEYSVAELEIRQLLSTIPLPDTAVALDALDSLAATDMRHLLTKMTVPTLIVNGAQDQICLPQASCYLKMHIHNAVQTIVPNCGHAPFLTYSDCFNKEIMRFTRSVNEHDARY